ncbi:MAG: hypothetical protein RLZZ607_2442, partial [Pseudomonadota bacterium]
MGNVQRPLPILIDPKKGNVIFLCANAWILSLQLRVSSHIGFLCP